MGETQIARYHDEPGAPSNVAGLYREHVQTVARWVARLGGPSVEVDDVIQEVFLVAHRRPFQPRGEAQVTTWLFRIAQRVVMSHRRKRRLWQWLRGSSIDAAGDVPVSGPSPLEEYEKREAVTTAYRILDDMPEKYRTIILLFEFEGLSGEEIASLTGITLDNVWVRIHRARAQFLERLSRADRRAR